MELEQLRMFLAVAEAKSFSAAAKVLFVSHSTTSRAVSALENELGTALMLHHHRTVTLTPAGEILQREARKILEMAEQAKEKVKSEVGVRSEE